METSGPVRSISSIYSSFAPKHMQDYISHKAELPWHVGSATAWTLDTAVACHGDALGTTTTMPGWVAGCWGRMLGVTWASISLAVSVGGRWHVPASHLLAVWPQDPSPPAHPRLPLAGLGGLQQVSAGDSLPGWGIAWIWEERRSPCSTL